MKRSSMILGMLVAFSPLAFAQEETRERAQEQAQERERDRAEEFAKFEVALSGAQEVPPVETQADGQFTINFNEELSEATYTLEVGDTQTPITAAHLHCGVAGENGPPVVPLSTEAQGEQTITNADIDTEAAQQEACETPINNIASLLDAMADNRIYVNVHTQANPEGELRAQIFPQLGNRE